MFEAFSFVINGNMDIYHRLKLLAHFNQFLEKLLMYFSKISDIATELVRRPLAKAVEKVKGNL